MDSDIYEDTETYNYSYQKEELTFKKIILKHLLALSRFSFVEFRGGFWEYKKDKTGTGQTYVQDTGEAYSNAIDCLATLLYPYFDPDMLKAYEEIEREVSKAIESHTKTTKLGYLGVSIENYYRSDQKPEEAQYLGDSFTSQKVKVMFRSVKLALKKRLFRDLSLFLFRKKYLELGVIKD